MSIRRRSRILALFLSLLPGWGQIYWGREKLGLALFTAFAGSVFLLGNGFVVVLGGWQRLFVWIGVTGVALSYVVAVADVLRRSSQRRFARESEAQERLYREGVVAYMSGDLREADRAFRGLLDIDPVDVEALFRLAVVQCRLGDARRAGMWLRKVRRFDLEGKWSWEIEYEEKRLHEAAEPSGRRRASGLDLPDEGSFPREQEAASPP